VPIIHARLLWPFSPYCISLFALSVIFLFCEYCHIIFCFVFIISFFFFFLLFRGNLSPSVFSGFSHGAPSDIGMSEEYRGLVFLWPILLRATSPYTSLPKSYTNPEYYLVKACPCFVDCFLLFFFSMFFFCFMRTIPKLQTNHNSTNTQRMNHLLPPKESNNCY